MSKPEFNKLFKSLGIKNDVSDNRRVDVRSPCSLATLIEPLDSDFQRCGDPFFVTSRDITENGIGFVYPAKVLDEYVRVELVAHQTSLIGRVCHNTDIGFNLPMYLVGIEFQGTG